VAEFQRTMAASDWAEGQVKVVGVAGKRIAVALAAGTFYAFDDCCTHEEASLADGTFDPASREIECSMHGARFDVVTGKPRCLPAVKMLKTYPVRVVDGLVEIQIG
jgi:3-phenylpropionate/trans-cinnamate dioxygenase ferredoxin component